MEVARCAMLCTLPAVLLDFVAAGLSVRQGEQFTAVHATESMQNPKAVHAMDVSSGAFGDIWCLRQSM